MLHILFAAYACTVIQWHTSKRNEACIKGTTFSKIRSPVDT
jgi:hypothetical protein